MINFILSYWAELALAFLLLGDTVVSLTPTKKDDRILGYLRILLTAIIGGKRKK
tara:strand:+ start:376 stop:537 length:162 start_codon:yes stop_codon:yes gene_type:complete